MCFAKLVGAVRVAARFFSKRVWVFSAVIVMTGTDGDVEEGFFTQIQSRTLP
jgi:hypothetical protein